MTPAYQVRAGDFDADADLIVALWAEQPDFGSRARAKLDHAYRHNPAGPGDCLLLADAAGTALGVLCLHARRLWHGGQCFDAGVLADYVVTRSQRSLGPALALMREGVRRGGERLALAYGLPNARSRAVMRRAGVPVATEMIRSGKLLRTAFLLRRQGAGGAWALGAGLADWALRGADRVLAWRYGALHRWRSAALDDLALDAVWQARPSGWLLSQRSPEFLAWRFATGPGSAPWQLDIAEDSHRQALGYVVWRLLDGVVQIADFLVQDPDRRTAALLLGFARRMHRRADVLALSVEFAGAPAVARGLREAGFVAKTEAEPVVAVVGTGLVPRSPARWYMTTFDRDPDV